MKDSAIEWTDHTFNPWWGCEKVSPGCAHCYAETFAKRTGHRVWGSGAEHRFFGDKHWNEPLRWERAAKDAGMRQRVFCASMADVFEDRRDLDSQRARLWDLIRATPSLDWLLLTKRPENFRMLPWGGYDDPWPNVWVGTTVEDQERADLRIPLIGVVPAVVRFLSCEPLLGPITLPSSNVHWVIVGGESGHGARPMWVAWAHSLVEQCRAAGIACFVKQLGVDPRWADSGLTPVSHAHGKCSDPLEWPTELRLRQFPSAHVQA